MKKADYFSMYGVSEPSLRRDSGPPDRAERIAAIVDAALTKYRGRGQRIAAIEYGIGIMDGDGPAKPRMLKPSKAAIISGYRHDSDRKRGVRLGMTPERRIEIARLGGLARQRAARPPER